MNQKNIQQLTKYATHFTNLFHTNCRIVDTQNQCFVSEIIGNNLYFGSYCQNKNCHILNTYLYGCNEAYRWGGKYIYYCPGGFVFVASSFSDDLGNLIGGLVLGPIIMGELDDTVEFYQHEDLKSKVAQLSNIPTDKVNDIAELLAAITGYISGVSHSIRGNIEVKQETILQSLYTSKNIHEQNSTSSYPIEAERMLQTMIHNGDKQSAQALLNELLGQIYFLAKFDVEDIKIHIIELLTILSRATIESGADPNEIIWFNTNCIKEMQKCNTIEELSIWITEIMHRFVNYSFDFSSIKHSDTVYKVIQYIRSNYFKKISLDEISKYVNFSKTYLSRIFKEETGQNISMYMNKVRIEKAKLFLTDKSTSLVDVANSVGFEDQSYFTKVFKSIVGTSPKKYQESRNKP